MRLLLGTGTRAAVMTVNILGLVLAVAAVSSAGDGSAGDGSAGDGSAGDGSASKGMGMGILEVVAELKHE